VKFLEKKISRDFSCEINRMPAMYKMKALKFFREPHPSFKAFILVRCGSRVKNGKKVKDKISNFQDKFTAFMIIYCRSYIMVRRI
jgi:hypothetical protein